MARKIDDKEAKKFKICKEGKPCKKQAKQKDSRNGKFLTSVQKNRI